MPHVILEYSAELAAKHDIASLVNELFETAAASGVFGRQDIRARAVPAEHTVSGAAVPGFAHVTLRLMDGRPDDVKRELADSLLTVLERNLPGVGALSVYPEEIEREIYARRVTYKGNDHG
jgi:5-carboxymethyl-2-hydroxymuconate isomerase